MDFEKLLEIARESGSGLSVEIKKISESEESIEVITDEDEILRREALEEIREDYSDEELAEMDEDEIDDLIEEYLEQITEDEEDDYDEDWDMERISLKRVIDCPYCGIGNGMDFSENCDTYSDERQMGPETTYSFDWEDCECCSCAKRFRVSGYICEYPVGAYNYEQIDVEEYDDEEE